MWVTLTTENTKQKGRIMFLFIAGVFVGAFIGFMALGLCAMASDQKEREEDVN